MFYFIERCRFHNTVKMFHPAQRLFACSNEACIRCNHHRHHPHCLQIVSVKIVLQNGLSMFILKGFSLFNKRSKHLMNFARAQNPSFGVRSSALYLTFKPVFGADFGQNNCQCKLCLEFFLKKCRVFPLFQLTQCAPKLHKRRIVL